MVSQISFYLGPSFYFLEQKKGNFCDFIVNFLKFPFLNAIKLKLRHISCCTML